MSLFCPTLSFSPSPSQRLGPDQAHGCEFHRSDTNAHTIKTSGALRFVLSSLTSSSLTPWTYLEQLPGSFASQSASFFKQASFSLHPPRQPRANGPASKKAGSEQALSVGVNPPELGAARTPTHLQPQPDRVRWAYSFATGTHRQRLRYGLEGIDRRRPHFPDPAQGAIWRISYHGTRRIRVHDSSPKVRPIRECIGREAARQLTLSWHGTGRSR